MLFDVLEGDCHNAKERGACIQASREVEKDSDFKYMCWYKDSSCRREKPEGVVKKIQNMKNAREGDIKFFAEVESFLELHLFMFTPISPRPLLVLPWEKWKQRDCCFLYF